MSAPTKMRTIGLTTEISRLRAIHEGAKLGTLANAEDIAWLIGLYQEAATTANNQRDMIDNLHGMLKDNNANCERMDKRIKELEYDCLKLRNKHHDMKKLIKELYTARGWFFVKRKRLTNVLQKYDEVWDYINDAMTRDIKA